MKLFYEGAAGRKVELEDACLGITLYSPDVFLHLCTWQGAMRLQCVYNEAYHDKEAVVAISRRLGTSYCKDLGLQ